MIDWMARAATLAEELAVTGAIRDSAWQDALASVPRHALVPEFYEQSADLLGWNRVAEDDPATRHHWRDAVYRDATLVTTLRVSTDRFGSYPVPISSSTLPSLMLRMLAALDVRPGMDVLEIGTGCGYNAALLCARLGDRRVSSVDVEADLVELARHRLGRIGFRPALWSADSATARLPGFDRLIATCGARSIPLGWVRHARPGARLLVPITGPLADGALVRLVVGHDGVAEGRFQPVYAGFMVMRSPTAQVGMCHNEVRTAGERRVTHVDPALLDPASPFAFFAQQSLPELGPRRIGESPEGAPVTVLNSRDGSSARVEWGSDQRGSVIRSGPTDLWSLVEQSHQRWTALGAPGWERFGLTVSGDSQWTWLDEPGDRIGVGLR